MNRNDVAQILRNWQNQAGTTGSVLLKWNVVNDAIKCLEEITGKDPQEDPFKNLNDTLFREVSLFLGMTPDNKQLGINSFKRYYEKCLELELKNDKRIHKGDTLHWIGRFYYELKKFDEAFYYMILDFLDDILSEFYRTTDTNGQVCISDSLRAPVCEVLQLYFDIPIINLQNLRNNALQLLSNEEDIILNPEVLKFKLRQAGHQTPRLVDYQSYHPNLPYLRSMYDRIKLSNDFILWEQFAAFLLSAVDGLEPITNLSAGAGSYEFDVIIRNCGKSELFLSRLGDYIGVECKYLQEAVDVKELDHFASKLKYHDMKCGIVFSRTPISGWKNSKGEQYGKLVQTKIFNRNSIIIFDINKDDVEKILEGMNLIELAIEKYEDVRLGL
jgi:tetratricopeptide (TPR) repeat protein